MTDRPSLQRDSQHALDIVDEICDRFEQQWKSGDRPSIEEYLRLAELAYRPQLLRELLLLDVDYCRRTGRLLDATGYLDHIAANPGVIAQVLQDVAQGVETAATEAGHADAEPMARPPYHSGESLADDLHDPLDKPVVAGSGWASQRWRRLTPFSGGWRIVTTIAVGFAGFVILAFGIWSLSGGPESIAPTSEAVPRQEHQQILQELRRHEKSRADALEVIRAAMATDDSRWQRVPPVPLLKAAKRFYEREALRLKYDDPDTEERLECFLMLGHVQHFLGNQQQAADSYRRAEELLANIRRLDDPSSGQAPARTNSRDNRLLAMHNEILLGLARVAERQERPDQSLKMLSQRLQLLQEAGPSAASPSDHYRLARAHYDLAEHLQRVTQQDATDSQESVLAHLEQAIAILEQLARHPSGLKRDRHLLARCYLQLARAHRRGGDFRNARLSLEAGGDLVRATQPGEDESPAPALLLAMELETSRLLRQEGEFAQGIQVCERALEVAQRQFGSSADAGAAFAMLRELHQTRKELLDEKLNLSELSDEDR